MSSVYCIFAYSFKIDCCIIVNYFEASVIVIYEKIYDMF